MSMSEDPTARRWRVYLPPNTVWSVMVTYGTQWDESQGRYVDGGGGGGGVLTGELTLEANVARDLDSRAYVTIARGGGGTRVTLPASGVEAIRASGKATKHTTGLAKQETFDSTGDVHLFRWHRQFDDSSLANESPAGESMPDEYGFAIHLEERTAMYQRLQQMRQKPRPAPPP
jgi:hypothetical protein